MGLLVAVLAVLAVSPALSLDADPPKGIDLSGDWQLEPTLSEDPHAVLNALRAKLARHAAPPRMTVPLDASGRPSADPEGDRELLIDQTRRANAMLWARLAYLLQSPESMSLTQTAAGLTAKTEDGTDEYEAGGGRTVVGFGTTGGERQAGWHHRDFVVQTRGGDGIAQERAYTLDPAGHLVLVTRVTGGGLPKLSVRSVYVRGVGPRSDDVSRLPAT